MDNPWKGVICSIIFFEKEGLSKEEINSRLLEFKGHLKEFFDDAYDALEIIKSSWKGSFLFCFTININY